MRLTFANDELSEKLRHFERKFASLAARCGASQEDLDAVERMIGGQASAEAHARRREARAGPAAGSGGAQNRSEVHEVNSYNFYGEQLAQDSPVKRDPAEQKPKKTKIVEVIDFGAEDTGHSREH